MIVFLGLSVGLITLFVPSFFWPENARRFPGMEFSQQYPGKKWVYYLHIGLPIGWLPLYLVVISPLLWVLSENLPYLMAFVIGGGLAFVHGIIEISTSVSMRNFSRGEPAQYILDESVKRLGQIRVAFVLVLGFVPLLFVT